MYKFYYNEVLDESPKQAREQERTALEKSIALLQDAQQKGASSREAVEAFIYLDRFWKILLEDLAHPDNGLPQSLKASLISVGIWVLREIEALRLGRNHSFDALIEVNVLIRDGLKEH